jgi:response regulator NasT
MLRVMLVDDSQKDVSLLKEGLQVAGYDVVCVALSAAALLEHVGEVEPDVIIIDAESPTRDTLEQLSIVSARQPRPIVLFTEDRASANDPGRRQGGRIGLYRCGHAARALQPILEVAVARFEQERALRDELRDAHSDSKIARSSSAPRAS